MISFIKNRPPLVLFFVCLLTLTITIFGFSFLHTEPVPDSDRNHDWVMLLRHFNALNICFEANGSSTKSNGDEFKEMTTVQALISINNTDIFKKFTSVTGFLTLDKWHTNCPKNYDKPKHLSISFDVPEAAKTDVTCFDACASIQGPEEYLPKFSQPNCVATSRTNKQLRAYLSSSVAPSKDSFCNHGYLTKLKFYPQDKRNFASFLNEDEKGRIYVHLLWTSYFLLFVLLIIFIYATVHS